MSTAYYNLVDTFTRTVDYRFNDAPGATRFADSSGNNRFMDVVGTPGFETPAKVDNAVSLNGTQYGTRVITTDTTNWFSYINGSNNFSLFALIRLTDHTSENFHVIICNAISSQNRGFFFAVDHRVYSGNNKSLRIFSSGGGGFTRFDHRYDLAIQDNEWHSVAVIRDGNDNKFYVDGILRNTITQSASAFAGSSNYGPYIGTGRTSAGIIDDKFIGDIDHIFVSPQSLTDDNIRDLHLLAFSQKSNIVINSEPVTPLLIDPAQLPANLWADTRSDGLDIAVTAVDSNIILPRQILDFDGVGNTGEIWVQNPNLASSLTLLYGSGVNVASAPEAWQRSGDTAQADSNYAFFDGDTVTDANDGNQLKLRDVTGAYGTGPTAGLGNSSAVSSAAEVAGLNGQGLAASFDGTSNQGVLIEQFNLGGVTADWTAFAVLLTPISDSDLTLFGNFSADRITVQHSSTTNVVTIDVFASNQQRTFTFSGITSANWTANNWFVGVVNDFTGNQMRCQLNATAAAALTAVTADLTLRRVGRFGSNFRQLAIDHIGIMRYAMSTAYLDGVREMLMSPATYATYSEPAGPVSDVVPDNLAASVTLAPSAFALGATFAIDSLSSQTTVDPQLLTGAVDVSPDALDSASTLDASALSVGVPVSPDNSASQTSIDATDIQGESTLLPDEASSATTIDEPALAIGVGLTPDDIASLSTLEASDVVADAGLVPAGMQLTTTLDPTALLLELQLSPDNMSSVTAFDPSTIQSIVALVPAELSSGATLDASDVMSGVVLAPAELVSGTALEASALALTAVFLPDALASSTALDSTLVAALRQLAPADLTTVPTMDPTELAEVLGIDPDDLSSDVSLDVTLVPGEVDMAVDDLDVAVNLDAAAVFGQIIVIAPDDARADTYLDVLRFPNGPLILPPDALCRLLIVAEQTDHVLVVGQQCLPIRSDKNCC